MRAGVSSPCIVSTHRGASHAERQDQQAAIKKEAARTQTQVASEAGEPSGFDTWDATTRRRATYRVLFGQPLLSARQRRQNVAVDASDTAISIDSSSAVPVKHEPPGVDVLCALSIPLGGGEQRRNSLDLLDALEDADAALLGARTALESEDADENAILSEFPPVLELAAGELEDADDLLAAVDKAEGIVDASPLDKGSVSTTKGDAMALKDAFTSRLGERRGDRGDPPLALELARPEDLDEILRLIDANDALSPAAKRPAARKAHKTPVEAAEGVSLAL